ncbi:protein ALTERED SEED GERMINATION 2-like isoform X2 [Magnolia sinica]|uniref:protein ALTERED SEED GERMINATION 2-like isoform X2 n=1 Tax=Magnolia sinica TaxID=86752 RepID=UPI00265A0CCC|nr:protein ALTERED SEED GERMINATION 2-like isoform X2 [Magnolia sinica]
MEDIKGGESSMRYRAGDVAKQMDLDPLLSGAEPSPSQPILLRTGAPHDSHTSSRLRKSYELVQAAEKSLEGPNYSYGIEACSEVLDGNGPEIGTKLKHDCLSTRAALFLKLITLVKLLQRSSTQASKSLVHGEEMINYVDILEMEQCRGIVVASAVFGNYDIIQQPRNISEAAKRCLLLYVCG